MVRKSRLVETRLIAEYIVAKYGEFQSMTGVKLGVFDTGLEEQLGTAKALAISRPLRPEADAIVILPNYFVLIEAKVWQYMMGLGKLPLYKSLIPMTPELKQYMPRQVLMELVVPQSNKNMEIMARSVGVSIRIFRPAWIETVIDDYNHYWTKEYRAARADKLALRQEYGLE